MKKSIITLFLVLIIGTSFAQNYQVVRKIVATPDCRTRFLNSQNVQIFEVNSFDMTYNFLSSTQLQIRDYKNSVTIYKAQTSSPIFDSLPSFLDSIKTACLIFSDTAGIFGVVAGNNITIDNSNIKFPIINAIGGSILASNGNYVDNDSVKLGGALTENTIIERNNNDFIISNDSSEFLLFDNSFSFYSNGTVDLQGQNFGLTSNSFVIGNYEDSLNLIFTNLKRKDTVDYLLGVNESSSINPLIKKYTLFRTPISVGGGGSSYFAKNGIYIDSDTIKLGGNITEDTKLDNPNSKSVQIGSDGDAMNLNVVPSSPSIF